MNEDIKKEFEDLVKKYLKDLNDVNRNASGLEVADATTALLDVLVDDLVDAGADHWYSSSADC